MKKMVLSKIKTVSLISMRTFKNFGHKREPLPVVTFLWHGFLTFTFIGLGIEWEKIAIFFFGKDHGVEEAPWIRSDSPITGVKTDVDDTK